MHVPAVPVDHPEVRSIAVSSHCLLRFRRRMPVREPGVDEVAEAVRASLERADITAWPPAWAVSDRPTPLWAVDGDLAYPLAPGDEPGRFVAVTCLRRGGRA